MLCKAGTPSGLSGTGPWSWSCIGKNGGTTASCAALLKVNSKCGPAKSIKTYVAPTVNLCLKGNATSVTTAANFFTWSCTGVNGGTSPACRAPEKIDGHCGAAAGTQVPTKPTGATNLCSIGKPSLVAGGGKTSKPWSWSCAPINGGVKASCSAPNGAIIQSIVNGVCGSSNGTTVSSAPLSNLCSTGSASSVAGAGPWSWSCAGSGGGTSSSCSANKTLAAVNGACGSANGTTVSSPPTANLCATGSASGVSGTGPFSWSCAGSGGGTTSSCSANKTATPTNGACGSSNGVGTTSAPTANLCTTGSATSVSGSGPFTWSCSGTNGGTTASCQAPLKTNGTCGAANGVAVTAKPTTGLCTVGTSSSVAGTGPFTWTCTGTNGGTTASCSAPLKTNGACGAANGTTVATVPTTNLCGAGTSSSIAGSGPWTWTCIGTNGGTTSSCSANKTATPTNGACGSANGTTVSSAPTTNLCTTGTSTSVSGTGPWSWSCTGANGGTTASCSASKTATAVNGACGSANGTGTTSAPSANLCTTGSATSVSGTGPFTWSCAGSNGGTTASCSAPLMTNGVCGTSNATAVSSAPTTNLCSTGTSSSVSGSGPWAWSCTGTNGGTTASCSASKSGSSGSVETPGPSQTLFNNPYYSCVTNYYVSPTGNDSNAGTQAAPWKTLQKASNTVTGAGSCINVAPGTYDGVQITHGGNNASATGYIAFRCTTMDGCTVTGNAGPNGNAAFTDGYCGGITGFTCPANSVIDANYVIVDGFTLAGRGVAGGNYSWGFGSFGVPGDVTTRGPHHVWLLNSIVHDFGESGIAFGSSDYLYALHDTAYNNSQVDCDGTQGSGIAFNSLVDVPSYTPTADDQGAAGAAFGFPTWSIGGGKWFHTVAAFNISYNNSGLHCTQNTDANGIIYDSITPGDNAYGGYTDPELTYGNVVYNNGSGGVHIFGAVNVYVANNTVFNNFIDPNRVQSIGGSDIDDYGRSDTTDQNFIYNNIVAACTSAFPSNLTYNGAMGLGGGSNDPAVGNMTYQVSSLARCATNSGGGGTGESPPEISAWSPQTYSHTTNFLATNPLWANVSFSSPGTITTQPASANFALASNSPAIGKGTVLSWMPAQSADLGACHHSLTSCGLTNAGGTPADTTAPSAPTGLTATAASSTQINLSWTASTDNVGVTAYQVLRNGTPVGAPTATSYSDTGLTASTSYSYTVKASDGAGNVSAASAAANATTQSVAVNGACGSANGTTVSSAPTTNFCSAGTATPISGTGPWSWTCTGSNGGTTASCSASKTATAVNGACGNMNGTTTNVAPSTGLCGTGAASAVTGTGPWNWTCSGSNGGTTASCSANSMATAEKPGPSATLFANPFYSCARNFYVSTTGNDSNPGTQAQPWLTIQHADSASRRAGDCINVAAGTYQVANTTTGANAGGIAIQHGGNAPTPTGYVAYRCQTLDGCHILATQPGVVWLVEQPANYVVIDGFEVDGNNALQTDGIGLACIASGWDESRWSNPASDGSHHIWVINNIVHHCNLGGVSFSNSEWHYVIHNTVYHNSWTSGYEGSGLGMVVENCIEAGNPSCYASTTAAAGTGTYVPSGMDLTYAPPYHIVIADNDVYDNSEAHNGITCGNMTDGNGIILDTWFQEASLAANDTASGVAYPYQSLVAGNLSHDNGGRGIHVFATSNVTVANNTVYANGKNTCINGYYLADLSEAGGTNNVWINNVAQAVLTPADPTCGGSVPGGINGQTSFCGNRNAALVAGNGRGVTSLNNTYSHNILYGGDGIQLFDNDVNYLSCSNNKCNTNPLLANPASGNFLLQPGSPATGYGLTESYLPSWSVDAGACSSNLTSCP